MDSPENDEEGPVTGSVMSEENERNKAREMYAACLSSEAENLRSLIEMEPSCKWPLAAKATVLKALVHFHLKLQAKGAAAASTAAATTATAMNNGVEGQVEEEEEDKRGLVALREEWAATVETLKCLDPARGGYYASLQLL